MMSTVTNHWYLGHTWDQRDLVKLGPHSQYRIIISALEQHGWIFNTKNWRRETDSDGKHLETWDCQWVASLAVLPSPTSPYHVTERREERGERTSPELNQKSKYIRWWSELQHHPVSQFSLRSYFLDSCSGIVSSWCLQLRTENYPRKSSPDCSLWRHSVRRHELSLHQSEIRPAGVVQWAAARPELRESPEVVAGAPWYSGWG